MELADDLRVPTSPPDPHEAGRLAAKHGVVQILSPPDTPGAFVEFLAALGPLIFTEGETPVPGHPDLNVVTNVGRKTPPKSVFHSDTSYVPQPPSYSALIAIDVPDAGGATLFTDQYLAFETLPPDLQRDLMGASLLHGPSDVPVTEAQWHPLVRRNPITGRAALFLTSLARCRQLVLRDGTDRSDLIERLYTHSIDARLRRQHQWRKGDVILWDNRCTLHAADHSAVVGDRTLYRGMVEGEAPLPAHG